MNGKLDDVDLAALPPGRHTDGGGLSLLVKATGRRSWTWRGRVRGKRRDVGLGSLELVGLDEARAQAAMQRAKSAKPTKSKAGRPDVESVVRATVEAMGTLAPPAAAAPHAVAVPVPSAPPPGQMSFLAPAPPPAAPAPLGGPTLGELWLGYVELSRGSWSESTIHNWLSVHEHHLQGLADRPAAGIERRELLDLIQPLWSEKRPTARRTLQGLSKIFELGIARGELETNPTTGLLAVLPKGGHDVEHRKAVPWPEAPAVLAEILSKPSATRHALAFLVLTAARPTEVLEATWGEIDLASEEWTIPASRMKKRRLHRVPLSSLAVKIARIQDSRSGLVFPGREGRPLTTSGLRVVMRRMGRTETVHGWRSTFRDWSVEQPDYDRETSQFALSHIDGPEAEQAYRRHDFFERRRVLMEAYCAFLTGPGPEPPPADIDRPAPEPPAMSEPEHPEPPTAPVDYGVLDVEPMSDAEIDAEIDGWDGL